MFIYLRLYMQLHNTHVHVELSLNSVKIKDHSSNIFQTHIYVYFSYNLWEIEEGDDGGFRQLSLIINCIQKENMVSIVYTYVLIEQQREVGKAIGGQNQKWVKVVGLDHRICRSWKSISQIGCSKQGFIIPFVRTIKCNY